jgi:predicted kinase
MMRFFILMVGLPASGKTTLRKRVFPDALVVCPDDGIGYTKDRPWTPQAARKAWADADERLGEAMAEGGPDTVLLDATNVAPKRRRKYIRLAEKAGMSPVAIVCGTPVDECLRRNASRDEFRRVPEEAIRRMESNFQMPQVEEGFLAVVLADGDPDRVRKEIEQVVGKEASPA